MDTASAFLAMWTIYDHPLDYPGYFVARRWIITSGNEPRATSELLVAVDLASLREIMNRRGLHCLPRDWRDDPKIVETWI